MHTEHNPLLAQVPLTVSPFITLPKAPTLPHNYAALPSTLPPSILSSPPTASTTPSSSKTDQPSDTTTDASSEPQQHHNHLPAYVTSGTGFRAHPSSITSQNLALRNQLSTSSRTARAQFQAWCDGIRDRELAEKRRKAPGWLDSDAKILRPEKAVAALGGVDESGGERRRRRRQGVRNLMDEGEEEEEEEDGVVDAVTRRRDPEVDDLGAQMDRAFG